MRPGSIRENPDGTVSVYLTEHNLLMAGLTAVRRHITGIDKPGRDGLDNKKFGWQTNCQGTQGEVAVAKYLDVFWDGAMGDFGADDAGPVQVRATANPESPLRLYRRDKDHKPFVLALCHDEPRILLKGWIYAVQGKQEKWWGPGNVGRAPYFHVPQQVLRPMAELRAMIKNPLANGGVALPEREDPAPPPPPREPWRDFLWPDSPTMGIPD